MPECNGCHRHVEYAPPHAHSLIVIHASGAFFERRNGERVGKSKRCSWSRLKEDLVGDTAVLVFMTSSLADALQSS